MFQRWRNTAGTIAQAVQPAVHDVTDGSVLRSWLNSPLSSGLEQDVYKATNILHSFAQVGYLQPEKGIPATVLQGAAGFAILSVVKVTCATAQMPADAHVLVLLPIDLGRVLERQQCLEHLQQSVMGIEP